MKINRLKPKNSITSGAYFPAVEIAHKDYKQLFISGQGTKDSKTGVRNLGTIKEQAITVMENLKNVVESCGYSMDNIAKTTIFLIDINDFDTVNTVYKKYFAQENLPSRSTVSVKELPGGQALEIEAIAFKKKTRLENNMDSLF